MTSIVFTVGRFNPPTAGHEKLIQEVKNLASERSCDYLVGVTRTQEENRNPLSVDEKLKFLGLLFPGVKFVPVVNAFEAGKELVAAGYTDVTFVVGEDRAPTIGGAFIEYATKGDSSGLGFSSADLRVVGRSGDSVSATKARAAVKANDFQLFSSLISGSDEKVKRDLYESVSRGMGHGVDR